jgi:hypothetical protein
MKKVMSKAIVLFTVLVTVFTLCGVTGIVFNIALAAQDKTPPVVHSYSLTPTEFDTSSTNQIITFEAVISDDLSGVCSEDDCLWDGVQVGFPIWPLLNSTLSTQYVSFDVTRTSGDDMSGTYTGTATVPRWAKTGIWELTLMVWDKVGNRYDYTPQELSDLPDGSATIANTSSSSSVTIDEEWQFYSSDYKMSATFPQDTIVTRRGGGSFEFYKMVNQDTSIESLPSIDGDPVLAMRLGIPGLNLDFSEDVTVSVDVGGEYEGETLLLLSMEEGDDSWANEATCTVSDGMCSFSVDHATYFAVTEITEEELNERERGIARENLLISPKILTTSGPGEVTRLQAYSKGTTDGSNALLDEDITGLFPESYTGGAGIVPIDQNNNHALDQFLIFAINNGGPQARVMGLKENGLLSSLGQMFVFDSSVRDGLSATVGDFDSDGYQDDAAFCLTGDKEPTVRVYKDVSGIDNWEKIGQFTASFGNVGCNLGTFQYDDGPEEILVTPNHGPAEPYVYIYTIGGTLKEQFKAYDDPINQGLTADSINDRIYTTPNNGSSQVNAFDREGERKNFWWVYENQVRGDFTIRAGQLDPSDEKEELLISPIGSNGPHILGYRTSGVQKPTPNFFAFGDETLRNGVGIAVIENWHGVN